MNEHEEKIVSAFVLKEKQDRYRFLLGSSDPRRRGECLNRLNHWGDLDERYVIWQHIGSQAVKSNSEIAAVLRAKGCPKNVYVMGGSDATDGTVMPLAEALDAVQEAGWGAILSCIPGQLAYFYDEEGTRRAILERTPSK